MISSARAYGIALLFALVPVVWAPTPALAQQTADDTATAMARARFKEGVEFYDKREYDAARVSFLQAYALKKHPSILLNLAWSCLKSGHPLEAERYFSQFLSEGKDLTDKQRADANNGLSQSSTKLGRIEVVAPSGTEVAVDGHDVGSAPLADPVFVEPGAHTLKFRGADGAGDTQSVSVLAGEKAVARFRTMPTAPAGRSAGAAPGAASAANAESGGAPAQAASPEATEPTAQNPPPPAAEAHDERAAQPASAPTPEAVDHGGALAPPKNLVPVVALGIAAVAGYGVAVGMFAFKQSAQGKANGIVSDLTNAHASCGQHPDACNAYSTDVGVVNDDATVGNVALVVGGAATVGAVVYWLTAAKRGDTARVTGRPTVVPLIGPKLGGASLAVRF